MKSARVNIPIYVWLWVSEFKRLCQVTLGRSHLNLVFLAVTPGFSPWQGFSPCRSQKEVGGTEKGHLQNNSKFRRPASRITQSSEVQLQDWTLVCPIMNHVGLREVRPVTRRGQWGAQGAQWKGTLMVRVTQVPSQSRSEQLGPCWPTPVLAPIRGKRPCTCCI